MRRTVFVHCGLHKTGTTAIQLKLEEDRSILRTHHNILYPASIDGHAGHHNLAWELAGDPRFNPSALTTAQAVAQITAYEGGAVLSSEDFETFLHNPAKLAPLVQPLRDAGHDVRLLIYFRHVTPYMESLFLELLLHGYVRSFAEFSTEIRSTGQLRYRSWVFQFDQGRIRDTLAHWSGADLKIYDYDEIARAGSVVRHFLLELGIHPKEVQESGVERAHARPAHETLLCCYIANTCNRPLTSDEIELVGDLLLLLNGQGASLALERVYTAHTASEIIRLSQRPDEARRTALVVWWAGKERSSGDIS